MGEDAAPAVSVIIATYNWSAALQCALRAVRLQTFTDFEVLVVGDACTDDSAEVVARFGDPRFHWHNLERNHGSQYGPNNHGLAAVRGTWIAYLGHDDIWYPTHLETCLKTAIDKEADYVASGMVLYGPPGSGIYAMSGLLPAGTCIREFFPPTSVMHRTSIVERAGYWQAPETLDLPTDCAFQLAALAHGARLAVTGALTAFKFNSAWRRDSYKRREVGEQEAMLAHLERGHDIRATELMAVMGAVAADKCFFVEMPPHLTGNPGHMINRTIRGLKPQFEASQLHAVTSTERFEIKDQPFPFEWHGPEVNKDFGAFRWSGPLLQSNVVLPVLQDRDLVLRVHVLSVLDPAIIESLKVFVNGRRLEHEVTATPEGTRIVSARIRAQSPVETDGTRITFEIAKTVRPRDISKGANPDRRWLGLAVNWIELAPVAE